MLKMNNNSLAKILLNFLMLSGVALTTFLISVLIFLILVRTHYWIKEQKIEYKKYQTIGKER